MLIRGIPRDGSCSIPSSKSGTNARFRAPSPHHLTIHPSTITFFAQPLSQNHPQLPACNSAGRSVVDYQAKNKPHATGTRVAVPSAGWLAPIEALQSGTIVANPRRRRGEAGASSRCVDLHSSSPSPCWRPHGTAERQPRIRFCPRRSRTLHRGSVAVRERLGSCECHGLRGARPFARGCSSDSSSNRCRPSEAIAS